MRQLFYNLIDNSLKYGKNVGLIRVYYETGKSSMRLIYEDNGVGISREEGEDLRERLWKGIRLLTIPGKEIMRNLWLGNQGNWETRKGSPIHNNHT